jgi:hypothetical protein
MRTLSLVLLALALLFSPNLASATTPAPTLTTLSSGASLAINQELAVNVVFVGYDQGSSAQQINTTGVLLLRCD